MSNQQKREMLQDLIGVSVDDWTDEQVDQELFFQLEEPVIE